MIKDEGQQNTSSERYYKRILLNKTSYKESLEGLDLITQRKVKEVSL